MAARYADTPADRAAWARLWDLVSAPWERLADLAEFLGVGRTTVISWGPGGDTPGAGPWCLLRIALRRTARRYPEAVPSLVEGLAGELLDVRGRWTPETTHVVGSWRDESDDVLDAHAALVRLVRSGAPHAQVVAAARELVVQAEELAQAAPAEAK